MNQNYSRYFEIDFVGNLRDLGGFRTQNGRQTAWRKVFRSAEPKPRTAEDIALFRQQTGISTILDLRGKSESNPERISLLSAHNIAYHNLPLIEDARGPGYDTKSIDMTKITSLGDFYLALIFQPSFMTNLVNALEMVANLENHPVLFHCAVGKDRTGILTATILSLLGVPDEDIVADYHLSTSYMNTLLAETKETNPGAPSLNFPAYLWEAPRESMEAVIGGVREKHGSFRDYLLAGGCDASLFDRLENALLD